MNDNAKDPAPPPAWALHRRLYDWTLSFSKSRRALPALFLFSVCESVFFPVPSLVLQIPMTLEKPRDAWRHAAVNTAGAIVGGLLGYAAGFFLLETVKPFIGLTDEKLAHFKAYADNAGLLIAGALAIHPFKLFTVTAGALQVGLGSFVLACVVGRGLLFFGIAALLWKFGAPVRSFIDRWFNWLCLGLGLLIAALVVAAKL